MATWYHERVPWTMASAQARGEPSALLLAQRLIAERGVMWFPDVARERITLYGDELVAQGGWDDVRWLMETFRAFPAAESHPS